MSKVSSHAGAIPYPSLVSPNETGGSRLKRDRCQATTKEGTPCSAEAVDSRLCRWHTQSPEWIEKRSEWSAKGGKSRSNAARARAALPDEALSPRQLACVLSKTLSDVLGGSLEPGRANAVSGLARTLVALSETVEIETRLTALETALRERRTA